MGFNTLVSDTSREIRKYDGEIDGVSYNYKTKEEFLRGIHDGNYIEFTTYSGNFYGLSKKEFEKALECSKPTCHVLDINGINSLKQYYGDEVLTVFILTSRETLKRRLNERGDSPKNIEDRLSTYYDEIQNASLADEIIENEGNLDLTLSRVDGVVSQYFDKCFT